MHKYAFLVLVLLVTSSCGPTMSQPALLLKVGREPAPGVTTVSTVGESIYSEFNYASQKGAELINDYGERFALGDIKVPAGLFLQARDSSDGLQYCTSDKRYYDPIVGPYDMTCFQDLDKDGQFERVRVPSIALGSWKNTPVGVYRETDIAQKGNKLELIYQGLLNNVIKIAYREYLNDLIRPAFQQEVNYTLERSGPTVIAFKGAKIEIAKATNSDIRYKILNPFKTQ